MIIEGKTAKKDVRVVHNCKSFGVAYFNDLYVDYVFFDDLSFGDEECNLLESYPWVFICDTVSYLWVLSWKSPDQKIDEPPFDEVKPL
jgi:hypothetical protein